MFTLNLNFYSWYFCVIIDLVSEDSDEEELEEDFANLNLSILDC